MIEDILREIGVSEGQTVLDFGCGSGNYTLPCARIVGEKGRVYAIDKDERVLNKLAQRAKALGLENVRTIKAFVSSKIPLETGSVDVAFLFDVIHSYYFNSNGRRRILREVHRVLKPNGLLLFYPGDPEVFNNRAELKAIKEEIREEGFHLEKKRCGEIIHEDHLVRGCVLRYRRGGVEKWGKG